MLGNNGTNTTVSGALPISIVNKHNSNNIMIYLSGLDANNQLIMLDQDGSYFYPTADSSTPTPLGSNVAIPLGPSNATHSLKLPGYIGSARMWVADGGLDFFAITTPNGPGLVQPSVMNPDDPNAEVNYAFVEFDWTVASGLYADITFVDFVGLPLGVSIADNTGGNTSAVGLPANAADVLCDGLKTQANQDGRPWDQLCVYTDAGDLIRVVSPSSYLAANSSAFAGYFSKYGAYSWTRFSRQPLTINTQAGPGNVTCKVTPDGSGGNRTLTCEGDNRGYPLPSAADVFGCNTGPFTVEATDNDVHRAVVPRLCAAFNRATLFLPYGDVQPAMSPSRYYSVHPANWYAALVHRLAVDGRGYAFAYDDVSPAIDENVSGLITSSSPTLMTITVGGA